MPVLVVFLVTLALTAGFCWGRGTAGAEVEADRAELAVEAHALDQERTFLECWARSLVVQEAQATTYTCHAAKEIYDQAVHDVPAGPGSSDAPYAAEGAFPLGLPGSPAGLFAPGLTVPSPGAEPESGAL